MISNKRGDDKREGMVITWKGKDALGKQLPTNPYLLKKKKYTFLEYAPFLVRFLTLVAALLDSLLEDFSLNL